MTDLSELIDVDVVLGSKEGTLISAGDLRPRRNPREQTFDATTHLPGRVAGLLGVPPSVRLVSFGVPEGPPQRWSRGKGPAWRHDKAGVDCLEAWLDVGERVQWDFEGGFGFPGFAPAVVLAVDDDGARKNRTLLLPLEPQPRTKTAAMTMQIFGRPPYVFRPERLILESDGGLDDLDVEAIQVGMNYQFAGLGLVGARIFERAHSPLLTFDTAVANLDLQVVLLNYGSEKRVHARFEGKAFGEDVRAVRKS